jgi:quinolinate synthase
MTKNLPTDLVGEIQKLKKDLNAVILAHYYQDEEIQDIADFIGDSLDLSRKAAATEADVIVFCGVKFMAEVAKILSPNKKVIIPDMNAGCSLEESCPPAAFKKFRDENPDHIALTYINCSAEIKALSDIIVTSANAKKIIEQIPQNQKIIFAPDQHLGRYLIKATNRDMLLWQGSCIVHEQFSEKELVKLKTNHTNAKIIAHPECPESLLNHANHIGSTSSLLRFVADNQGGEFIVLTEPHIIHQMKQKNPTAKFYDCPFVDKAGCTLCNTCPYMQLNTMEKLYLVMKNHSPLFRGDSGCANEVEHRASGVHNKNNEIFLDKDLMVKAKKSLDKMLEMS